MTSQYRHRRTSNPATVFPNPIEPGEITVNTANRQIAVGDAASATLGAPKPLLPIRYFDIAAQYVTNDFVVNGNSLYRANKATGPGTFTAADWVMMVGQTDPQYVEIAGDVMTGSLSLPAAAPTAGVHATNKTYVDNLVALKSSVIVSDVKPTPDPIDSTLWYNTLDGQLYIRYNDGNSTQWVIAAPQPDIGQFVNKTGDTMTGQLLIKYGAAAFQLNKSIDGAPAAIYGYSKDKARWVIRICDGALETGGNTGENFAISRYADDGSSYLGPALTINRATGVADFEKKPTVAGAAWAAPMDALAYSGMQINGGTEVSQENGTTGVTGANTFPCDGWRFLKTGTMVVTASSTRTMTFPGFPSFVSLVCNTAETPLGTSDRSYLALAIEGYRMARLAWGTANAQPITLGFWTAHSVTGIHSVGVRNVDATRSYITTYMQNLSNVPEYKVITIPGCVDGVWPNDNQSGLTLSFIQATGSFYEAPSINAWVTGNFVSAPGQVNGVATAGNVFRITGVVVLPGIEAPSAARSPLIMRPYDQELMTCQRYWRKIGGVIAADIIQQAIATAAGQNFSISLPLSPSMRSAPAALAVGTWTNANVTSTNFFPGQTSLGWQLFSTAAGGVQSYGNIGGITLDARL